MHGLSESAVQAIKQTAELNKLFQTLLTDAEKCSRIYTTQEAINDFFKWRPGGEKKTPGVTPFSFSMLSFDTLVFSTEVIKRYEPMALKLTWEGAPLGMLAVAKSLEDTYLSKPGNAG